MKLWLDDVRPAPVGWTWAKTVAEAKRYLLTGRVEEASLDHDLGGKVYVPSEGPEETGYTLVYWMVENNVWPKTKPVVHSLNPAGKANMQNLIDRYGPYG